MELDYNLIKSEQFKISNWSGGTSTELCIYPENSEYQNRDFTWRISSATVDLETSKFTVLSDYERIIMVLKGKLILVHDESDLIILNELDQYKFDGNANTDSKGKVTDFNLMMRKESCVGKVEVIQLDSKTTLSTIIDEEKVEEYDLSTDIYYNIKGKIRISINESKTIILDNKDILIVNKENKTQLTLFECYNSYEEEAIIIKSSVFFNKQ